MSKIKTAVVGIGYLGKYHTEKFSTLPQSELVAVCDHNIDTCNQFAQNLGVKAITDYRKLIGLVEAVSIAAPTTSHYCMAQFFLEQGVHTLVEKPIATTLAEAETLTKTAKKNNAILQIGHLERFNNVLRGALPTINNPRFIDAVRMSPFKTRCLDTNVILDLMIHDIDIIQSLVNAKICRIAANGTTVLSKHTDIASVRIDFENGCTANLTASRISEKTERKLRIFQQDRYISMDFNSKCLTIREKSKTSEMLPGIPAIESNTQTFEQGDALRDEIADFLNCIIENKIPRVTGEAGKAALETALAISRLIEKNNAYHEK